MSDLDFLGDFDAKKEAESANDGEFAPLKPGWYNGRITQAEVKKTKAGTGTMVVVRVDIDGPTNAGRVLFDHIIVAHDSSQTAQEIGRARFGSLCIACGFDARPSDTKELLGKSLDVKAKTEKSKEYGDRSVISAYRKSKAIQAGSGSGAVDPFEDDDLPF